jgi:hypothetical protein
MRFASGAHGPNAHGVVPGSARWIAEYAIRGVQLPHLARRVL